LLEVLPDLLDGPEVAGQAMLDRLRVLDDLDDLSDLVRGKRGARPPVLW
jgi:hypothetical protein